MHRSAPLHVKPFASTLNVRTWGQALAHCRAERGLSIVQVADRAGASPSIVRAWESGGAYPSRSQLKRLEKMAFQQIRLFSSLLPDYLSEGSPLPDTLPAAAPPAPKPAPPPAAAAAPKPAPAPPPPAPAKPATFGEALARARAELGISRKELADLCDVTPGAVDHWETGTTAKPSLQNYQKLLDLFPSIASAPKPDGMRNIKALAPISHIAPAAAAVPPPPPATPAPAPAANSLAAAGATYAAALGETARLTGELAQAKDRVLALDAALSASQLAGQKAHDALLRIARGE